MSEGETRAQAENALMVEQSAVLQAPLFGVESKIPKEKSNKMERGAANHPLVSLSLSLSLSLGVQLCETLLAFKVCVPAKGIFLSRRVWERKRAF